MKVVFITAGTLGDTAPYIGLGVRLKEQGFDVAIAAQESFADMIRAVGLEFRRMPGDIRADLSSENGRRMHRAGSWIQALPATVKLATKIMDDLAQGIVAAAEGAEILLIHRLAMLHGYLVAKAMGIPSLVLELFPSGIAPTGEFLPAVFGSRSLGAWGNRVVYKLFRASAKRSGRLAASLKGLQTRLDLPHASVGDLYRAMDAEVWPIYHGFSPVVVPRPADWREGFEVVGYFWPEHPPHWEPPAKLVDFLEAGPPPVFIGFGSIMPEEAERLSEIVTAAVRSAGVRAVIQSGWGGLSVTGDDMLSIGSAPHDWLFPKMAAVVHAASAGITGAGLRAGVPTVPVPALHDQPFWADRLVKLGVSPGAIRFQKLSAARLGFLIRQAVSEPSYRRTAETIAERVRGEDGAGRVVEAVQRLARGRKKSP